LKKHHYELVDVLLLYQRQGLAVKVAKNAAERKSVVVSPLAVAEVGEHFLQLSSHCPPLL
jgi:hypothetical protein